ncbi:MAG: transglutaminase-like domain-containing protein [Chitinophagaceae bacterium]
MALEKDNNWLNDDLKTILAGTTTQLEKAQKIYFFLRDHFTCTDYSEVMLDNSLKTIFKNKNGNVADINLLLVTMLRHENILADPLLLSTREHGFVNELYPIMGRFNYVIAAVYLDDQTYYLDAARPLGFGKLSGDCYNGVARVISRDPSSVYFESDSLKEQKFTNVFIINNEKGLLDGSFKSSLGDIESSEIRERINKSGKESFFKKIKSSYGSDVKIYNEGIDSLKMLEEPVAVRYDFLLNPSGEDIIYFNPIMSEGYKENIFKAAQRNYPVEMPFAMNETFVLNMETPSGYVIDEMPKSAKVDFNSGEGYFEYMIGKTATGIQLRSRIVLTKATFSPDDYNTLRDFFGYVVKKHGEQIVFKKQ